MSLLGTINHVSLTVSNLDEAMEFFDPWLDFLGYTDRERGNHAGTRMAININSRHGIAFNILGSQGRSGSTPVRSLRTGPCIILRSTLRAAAKSMRWPRLVERLKGEVIDGTGRVSFRRRRLLRCLISGTGQDEVRVRLRA